MTFVPPGENIAETKNCRLSGENFFITDKDLEFYDKISPVFDGKKYSIPSPTLCPAERTKRRMMFRNFQSLYNRKSDLSGKQMISMYHSGASFPVYTIDEWWSDDWVAGDYSIKYDSNLSIFSHIQKLQGSVPRIGIMNANCENCEFSNFSVRAKDNYLVFGCVDSEECMYGHIIWKSKNCINGVYNYECEYVYDSADCVQCYNLKHCTRCETCRSSSYLYECNSCEDCFGCVGLQSKKYHIFNTPYDQKEYESKLLEINQLGDAKHAIIREKMAHLIDNQQSKEIIGYGYENCSGDYIYFSDNAQNSFDVKRCENIKHCATLSDFSDAHDCNYHATPSSFMYNDLTCVGNNIISCHQVMNDSSNVFYSEFCYSSHDCFGCVGIKSKRNCIFNMGYSKQEYEKLVGKIIDQMRSEGVWGEFFEPATSPFGYNETMAHTYYPLTKEQAIKNGYNWKDEDEKSSYHGETHTPMPISQYNEEVAGPDIAQKNIHACIHGVIRCKKTGLPFKILSRELAYHIEHSIELPTTCWEVRYKDLMSRRRPRRSQ